MESGHLNILTEGSVSFGCIALPLVIGLSSDVLRKQTAPPPSPRLTRHPPLLIHCNGSPLHIHRGLSQ